MRIVTFERRKAGDAAPRGQGSMGAAALGFESLEGVRRGARRLGVILPEGPMAGDVADLNRALAVKLAANDAGAPEAEADSILPAETRRFVRRWTSASEAARATLGFVMAASQRYEAPDWIKAGIVFPRKHVRLCAPVPQPGKILAAGDEDLLPIATSSLAGPEDEVRLPAHVRARGTGALAAVIGRTAHRTPPDEALAHVAGYCAAVDFRALELAGRTLAPALGASCDTFTAVGPVLTTADEVPDPADLLVRTRCAGELVEETRSKELPRDLASLIAAASELMTLEPGDLVLAPLPRHTTRELRDGDVVEVEIERVGRLTSYVRNA